MYQTTGTSQHSVSILPGSNTLAVKGVMFTEISQIGPSFAASQGRPGLGSSFISSMANSKKDLSSLETCFNLARSCHPHRYKTFEDALVACQLCLVGGKTHKLERAKPEETRVGFRCFDYMMQAAGSLTSISKGISNNEDSLSSSQGEILPESISERIALAEKLLLEIRLATSGRTFFLTSQGQMGLATFGCKTGDKICVFHGMSVPFVLREVTGGYALQGECYVQDAMDGYSFHVEGGKSQLFHLI